jgi:hypothetical protein
MKLYTFYCEDEKVVYGTAVNGKSFFFFSGFSSAEEAKQATRELHLKFKKEQYPRTPESLLVCEIDMVLSGEWSEIE